MQGLLVGDVQMAEAEVPVYTTNEHFQGVDARNAEQTRAEMVSCSQSTCTNCYVTPSSSEQWLHKSHSAHGLMI